MVNGRLGFGFAGLGHAAVTHARQLADLKEVERVAVYGRNPEKAKRFAEEFGFKRWYTDYRRLLEDKEVDVIEVLTPNGLHHDFAVPAAEAGKHLIVEKPIDITLERADSIIDACRRNRVKLSVIFQMRFGRTARKIKQAIEAGVFGRLMLGDAYDKAFRNPEYYANDYWRGTKVFEGGGSLMTQTIHGVDLLQWFMGPVGSVAAKKRTTIHTIEVEDLVVATITFKNGALGVIESSTATYPGLKSRVEIHGEKASAIVSGMHDQLLFWNVEDSSEEIDAPPGFQFRELRDTRPFPGARHRDQLLDIAAAIREDRDPLVTGEEGRKALEIVLAIYKSAETGEEVVVSS